MDLEQFLEHHGVKGMRWGVRRSRSGVTRSHPQSSDSKKVAALKTRKPHQLSNKQLKSVNERLNLESNFAKLNPSKVQKGHNRVKEILAIAGTATALYGMSQTPGGKKAISIGKQYVQSGKAQVALAKAASAAKNSKQLSLF